MIFTLVVIMQISIFAQPVYADAVTKKEVALVYFYYDYCAACKVSEKTLKSLKEYMESNHVDVHVDIIFKDASKSSTYALLLEYYKEYHVPADKQKVPVAFVGDAFFSGAEEIKKGLLSEVNRKDLPETKIIELSTSQNTNVSKQFSAMKLTSVFMTGLVNGFNPCSLSMYLFILSLMLVKKISIRKIGFAFVASKFLTYLLLGVFLFNLISQLNIPWFGMASKIIMLSFVFVIAGINIRDFYFAKREKYGEMKMQLPAALRKMNHKWIKQAMSGENAKLLLLMSVLLGIVITIGEFLCSGQMYISTIIFMLKSNSEFNATAFLYLFIYDFAFILPLLAITIIIDRTRGVFEVSEKIRERLPLIKLINAIVFILFGLAIAIFAN
jgi:cytochrome c biogenesis protein CcdA